VLLECLGPIENLSAYANRSRLALPTPEQLLAIMQVESLGVVFQLPGVLPALLASLKPIESG